MSVAPQARARVGDVVIVGSHRVGEAERSGEIIEVVGEPGHEHYTVRWADGHESTLYPGSDTTIRPRGKPEAAAELAGVLESAGLRHELVHHDRTMTAGAEAAVLGIPGDQVAKTLVLRTADGFARVVIPASERLDIRKARERLGGSKEIRFATEEELAGAYPGFELGAVPPFGGPHGDRVLVDRRVAELEEVLLEAGTHQDSLRVPAAAVVELTKADVVDLVAD
jgi:Ala-tRNA(Pro) deacylase